MNEKLNDTPSNLPRRLDQVAIKTPCQMDWDLMDRVAAGDADRIRFCRRCEKNVYNIAAMGESEALELLHSNEPVCARIFRRSDGTIVTQPCPSPTPKHSPAGKRRFQFSLAALVVLMTASAGLTASLPWVGSKLRPLWERWAQRKSPSQLSPVMGEATAVPPAIEIIPGPICEELGDVYLEP